MSEKRVQPAAVRSDLPKQQGTKVSPYATTDNTSSAVDWSIVQTNAEDLRLLVAAILAAGDAVMFSCARKGVAYAITVYHDGIPVKKWAVNLEAFEDAVSDFTRIALAQIPQEVVEKLTLG